MTLIDEHGKNKENSRMFYIRFVGPYRLKKNDLTETILKKCRPPEEVILVDETTFEQVKSSMEVNSWNLITEDSFLMHNFSHLSKLCFLIHYLENKLNNIEQLSFFDFEFITAKIVEMLKSLDRFFCYEAEILINNISVSLPATKNIYRKDNYTNDNFFQPYLSNEKDNLASEFIKKIKNMFLEKSYNLVLKFYNSLNSDKYKYEFCKKIFNVLSGSLVLNETFIKILEYDFGTYLKQTLKDLTNVTSLVKNDGSIDYSAFYDILFNGKFASSLNQFLKNYKYLVDESSQTYENVNDSFYCKILLNRKHFFKELNGLVNERIQFFDLVLSKIDVYDFKAYIDIEKFLYNILVAYSNSIFDCLKTVLNDCLKTNKTVLFLLLAVFAKFFRSDSSFIEFFYKKIWGDVPEERRCSVEDFCSKLLGDFPDYFNQFKFLFAYYDCDWINKLALPNLSIVAEADIDLRHFCHVRNESDYSVYVCSNLPYIKYFCKFHSYNDTCLSAFSDEHNIFILSNEKVVLRIPYLATGLSPQYLSLMIFKFFNYLNYEKK